MSAGGTSSGAVPAPPGPSGELAEAFDRTVDALDASRAAYALIGGFAVAFHGIPRPTLDIDLLIAVPRVDLPGVLEKFSERGFSFGLHEVIRRLGEDHLATIAFGKVPVDLLDAVVPVFRRTVENAREEDVRGRKVRIARAEDLIALKMIAYREDDIRDVKGILAAKAGRLELDTIRKSLAECCDEDRIEAFEKLAAATKE